jgi:hypothetical protein
MDSTVSSTQGLYVIASTTTHGDCAVISSSSTPPFGTWIIGTMISTSTTINSTAWVLVHPAYRAFGSLTNLSNTAGTLLATATTSLGSAPSGDVLSADGSGNVTDSSIASANLVTSSSALTQYAPLVSNVGTRTVAAGSVTGTLNSTTKIVTAQTTPATQNLASWDGSGNVKDSNVPTTSAALLVNSYCNGQIGSTASTTYILTPFVDPSGSACNQTTVQEMPIPVTCTAKNLYATASAAGSSTSGVITVYYNNSIPSGSLTCTLGTGTSCHDTTDSVSMTVGNTYSVRVKTSSAGSDATANIRVSFVCQ